MDTTTRLTETLPRDLAQWDDGAAVDVVVVGSGAAGLSAALHAAMDGASVLLVEKTAFVGGTTALSAATTWVPCTAPGLQVEPGDTLEKAAHFLDLAVGNRSPASLRQAFLRNGPAAIAALEAGSAVKFQVRQLHPDYLAELEDSTLRGRAIEPRPFDARCLGPNLTLVRPPIPEFTVLGGMMVDRDDIFHLLRITQTWKSFGYSLKIIARHAMDRLLRPRGSRWVMGNALVGRLLYSLARHGGQLLTRTEPTKLIRQDGAVKGIRLRQTRADGSSVTRELKVRGGVVLASGGFNRHPKRRAEWLPGVPDAWSPAAPGHAGAAQDLALAVGARLGAPQGSAAFWAPVSLRKRADGSVAAFPHFVMDRGKPGTITVDQEGQRYQNEARSYHEFGLRMQAHHREHPSIPSWLVCDAPALKRYGLGMVRPGGRGLQPFLADGYLRTGRTLEELAQACSLPAAALQATVARYNQMVDRGADTDFGRGGTDYERANGDTTVNPAHPCLGALKQGPFYAVALYPGDIGASMGLVTDEHARVTNAEGQPIAGLYACGNDMQSIMGGVYPAPGITIGPALTFGYIAARHAVARGHGKNASN